MVEAAVIESQTMQKVPSDGKTIGEVMLRGVALMKGYLKDESATKAAFQGGWFHTGDLDVVHVITFSNTIQQRPNLIARIMVCWFPLHERF